MLSTVSDLLGNKIATTPLKIRLRFRSSKMAVRCPTAWKPVPFVIAINGNSLETGRLVRHSFVWKKDIFFTCGRRHWAAAVCAYSLFLLEFCWHYSSHCHYHTQNNVL